MSFNAAVPLSSASPAVFPAQNQTNMSRLQTLIGADHQFNLAAAGDDGYHNVVHLTQQAPSGALAATGRLFVKSSGGTINLFYMNEAGTGYQISPGMPIRAAVNFATTGAVGAQTLRSQYNVSSVTRASSGVYTVNFTTAIPDTNYIVQITGMRNTGGGFVSGCVQGDPVYGNSVTTSSLVINFFSDSGTLRDVIMGNVTIFSVT